MKENDISLIMRELGICILIPAYNCEQSIAAVVQSVLQYTADVIVVNDGSTDNTENRLTSFGENIVLLSYKTNKGKGYALKQGFYEAKKRGFSYVITIDSDGQHLAEDIPVFVDAISLYPNTLIIGARSFNHPNMPDGSIFANKFSNFWFTLQTAHKLPDTQSGYRLYPLKKMGKMRPLTHRYEAELELLVRCAWRRIGIKSVSIQVFYPEKEKRISHFRPKKDFFRISVLNTVLCLLSVIYGYPSMLIQRFLPHNRHLLNQILCSCIFINNK